MTLVECHPIFCQTGLEGVMYEFKKQGDLLWLWVWFTIDPSLTLEFECFIAQEYPEAVGYVNGWGSPHTYTLNKSHEYYGKTRVIFPLDTKWMKENKYKPKTNFARQFIDEIKLQFSCGWLDKTR